MTTSIKQRLERLRSFMQNSGYDAFIIPSTDPHNSEYPPSHWESRKWISGFTGSAGTAVITHNTGGVWTDSRYFLQAADQLSESGLILFKERVAGTPSIAEWLESVLPKGSKVAIDGWVFNAAEAQILKQDLEQRGLYLTVSSDPFEKIWNDRPTLPSSPVFIHDITYAGKSTAAKIQDIQDFLSSKGAEAILLSALDEIAWTLNLRGEDVHCNPVFVSYLLITRQHSFLYILPEKINPDVRAYLSDNNITVCPYQDISAGIQQCKGCLILPESINFKLYTLAQSSCSSILLASPAKEMKAVKNSVEIEGFRHAMERDGVAMVRFLKWLKEQIGTTPQTEISIDKALYRFRAEQKLFHGISFDTIAGYQAHGAIVHYEATEETDIPLQPEGLLLLDSGAQYTDGTTDITRTIVLGPITEEQKKDYTLVLKGMIQLAMAVFPEGTCGTQLDILARQFMWKAGINYGHGTGHGVGHFLNVHEGPHQIRMNHIPYQLRPGMTVTNEPGIYRTGKYGIRIENTMLICKDKETEFGAFYRFEQLTLCPIDKAGILTELLTAEEKEWLNQYHKHVYSRLSPMLTETEREWLDEATKPIK